MMGVDILFIGGAAVMVLLSLFFPRKKARENIFKVEGKKPAENGKVLYSFSCKRDAKAPYELIGDDGLRLGRHYRILHNNREILEYKRHKPPRNLSGIFRILEIRDLQEGILELHVLNVEPDKQQGTMPRLLFAIKWKTAFVKQGQHYRISYKGDKASKVVPLIDA